MTLPTDPRELVRGLMRGSRAELHLGYTWDNAAKAAGERLNVSGDALRELMAYARGFADGMRRAEPADHNESDAYLDGFAAGLVEPPELVHPAEGRREQ